MELSPNNRMITKYEGRPMRDIDQPVIIVKGIPGHPEGAIRRVRKEQAERWLKMGICRLANDADTRPAEAAPVKRKRGRPRKTAA